MSLYNEIATGLNQAITFEKLFSKPTLVVMIGLPGSGKSTIAQELAKELDNSIILSSDDYREKLCGDINDQSQNEKVFTTLYKDMISNILIGKHIIYDATNISRKDRAKVLEKVDKFAINKVAYFVDTPFDICLNRDAMRERNVGNFVIEKFLRRFEFPQKFEGFDAILIDSKRYDSQNVFDDHKEHELLGKMHNYNQKNPHHIYTLKEHCMKLSLQAKNDKILAEAGRFHDIGKVYTQRLDDDGIAHYYNHDSVGAYIMACNTEAFHNLTDWDDVYEALFYITYHMRAHNDFTHPKAEKKYRRIFGDQRYDKLMQFAEYDRIASGTYYN